MAIFYSFLAEEQRTPPDHILCWSGGVYGYSLNFKLSHHAF